MKLLILDDDHPEVDFALRCADAGHQVRWHCMASERHSLVGKGMVSRIVNWRASLDWADLIVMTSNTNYLREMDAWRARNPKKLVIGASQATAQWELDRNEGMRILKKNGVETTPYKEFDNYDQAIKYTKSTDKRLVSKPCGDEPDKSLSYVAKSPADMVYMLERWKKSRRHKGSFIMQDFIPGIEMAVGGWCGPKGFQGGFCENWEFKKLMNGDLGVATGEQGTVLRMVQSSKLAKMVLQPVEGDLIKAGYTGYIDVNCIIDDQGAPWPLEFTTRFGYPTFNIQSKLLKGDPVEWLAGLARGQSASPWQNEIACGIVLSIPDYPYSHLTKKDVAGIPIYGLSPSILSKVALLEVMRGEAPQEIGSKVVTVPSIVTAGDYVLVAVGRGETVKQARDAGYRVLKRVEIPNSPMYRTDIGNRLSKQIPALQAHGFATGMTF